MRIQQHQPGRPRRRAACLALALALVPASADVAHAYQQPFQFRPAEAPAVAAPLHRRQQGSCLANFYPCDSQGTAFMGVCCQNGQLCALDASNQPACCPAGAVCTGTAPATFIPPAATTAPVSFVNNPYFPFAYITTSFANQAACTAAVSQCGSNYDTCTRQLQGLDAAGSPNGQQYGVTIVVPGGGGTTVAATRTSAPLATATAVCSSLSSVACYGIQPTVCSSQGMVNGLFYVGSANAANARPTPPPRALPLGAVAVGVGLGIVGGVF